MRFRTKVEQSGKTATGIRIPDETNETRRRRIAKSVERLREGRAR